MAAILLDVDGVLHVSGTPIAGAAAAVRRLRDDGHRLRFVTNSTTSSRAQLAEQMKAHKCFKDVKISRTNQFGDSKQKYVLELDLKCDDVKKPKTGASPAGSSAAQPPAPAGDTEGR